MKFNLLFILFCQANTAAGVNLPESELSSFDAILRAVWWKLKFESIIGTQNWLFSFAGNTHRTIIF
jgi:hypothetical protein